MSPWGKACRRFSSPYFFVAFVFIFYLSSTFFLIQYDRFRTADPDLVIPFGRILTGNEFAPNQYRVGLPLLTRFIANHSHFRANKSLPFVEAASYAAALALLCTLLSLSSAWERSNLHRRAVLAACCAAAMQLPILWIYPWERPETLPSTCYLALIAVLVQIYSRYGGGRWLWLLAALASALQSTMRTDYPVWMGAAVFASAALNWWPAGKRGGVMALGLSCAIPGAAIQLFLQRVAYPHAIYPPGSSKFQLLRNLTPLEAPAHGPIFFTAMMPLALAIVFLWRRQVRPEPIDKMVLLACLLYVPLWFLTGLLSEVRIYVPFLFLAAPTMAKIFVTFLDRAADAIAERSLSES